MSDEREVSAYPLEWPIGWKRTPSHQRTAANFGKRRRALEGGYTRLESLTISDGLTRLRDELRRLGAHHIVISSNLRPRLDGLPAGDNPKVLQDPGIAVYFVLKGRALVLACDKWRSAADNMAAIAGHIEAIRAQERYGVGNIEQALAGYKALPADTAASWRAVFGFGTDARVTVEQVQHAFRAAARTRHPDTGGSEIEMAHLNRARDYALQELEG
jgi:hypothetical protein